MFDVCCLVSFVDDCCLRCVFHCLLLLLCVVCCSLRMFVVRRCVCFVVLFYCRVSSMVVRSLIVVTSSLLL